MRGGPTFVAVAHHPELGLSSSVRAHLGHEREGLSLHILDLRNAEGCEDLQVLDRDRRARGVPSRRSVGWRGHARHSRLGSHFGRSDHAPIGADRRRSAVGLRTWRAEFFLVDPDLDALGELSATLRGNGFTVLLADNVASCDRAGQASIAGHHFGVGRRLSSGRAHRSAEGRPRAREGAVDRAGRRKREDGALPPGYARRADLDGLMAKIVAAPPRSVPVEASQGEVRGDLSQVPLIDLLQALVDESSNGCARR